MHIKTILAGLIILSISYTCAEDEIVDDETLTSKAGNTKKEPGLPASTDTTLIAGKFEVSFFSNSTAKKGSKRFRPCSSSKNFTITFPEGSDGEIIRDVSKFPSGKDPLYGSTLGKWKVTEFAKIKSWHILKSEVLIGDIDQSTIVCWLVRYDPKTKRIDIDINPSDPTECLHKAADYKSGCLYDHAYVSGTCIEGKCMGEKTNNKEANKIKEESKGKESNKKSSTSDSRSIIYNVTAFFIPASLWLFLFN